MSRKDCFIADQRGAVAFETIIVYLFLVVFLLLPLADLAIAGLRFNSAQQALRDMGQRTQFGGPDVTSSTAITNWKNSLPATVDGYPVSVQIYCGNNATPAPCATGGTTLAKYYTFTTSFTLSPISPLVGPLLCSTCTVTYSQPFQ